MRLLKLAAHDRYALLWAATAAAACLTHWVTDRDALLFLAGISSLAAVYSIASVASRAALERLEAQHRRVLQAVESAAETVLITGADGTIQYVNPAFSRLIGYSRQEAVGTHIRLMKSGAHGPDFYREMWRVLASGRVWMGRFVNKRKDGTTFEEEASIAPIADESGRIVSYVAVKRDISKERSLEAQLLQAQKMEAVGRLAGGVAHDFNNILTAILGFTQLCRGAVPPGSALDDDLSEVERAARRAAELTRQLLIFSRKQLPRPQLVDPAVSAASLQKMLGRIVGEDMSLRLVAESRGGKVLIDPGNLEQVIMNLVVNSRDALPRGGTVEVAVRERTLTAPAVCVDGLIPAGDYVVVSVKDTGCGIPPAVLPRIFEPFFTTKPLGEGTGLGLAMVFGIAKQSGGYLTVESVVGSGTTIAAHWPRAQDAPAAPPSRAAAATAGGTEHILLVEDEPAVLQLASRLLQRAGYGVTAFSEPRAALAWLGRPGADFKLLVSDMIMPGGLNGKDLAEAVRRLRPDAKVLYVSGYSDDQVSPHGVQTDRARLLPKPFSEETLLRAVREALDAA
ncbi:MAG: PAS domain S-box protein [Elusimicrobia bacterium]|nr:PAS domain S-box protein [Elusimicrobiota bacterium]